MPTTTVEFQRYDLVKHRRTQNFYKIDRFLQVRIGPVWEAGVGYFSVDDYESYFVRTLADFIESFELVEAK